MEGTARIWFTPQQRAELFGSAGRTVNVWRISARALERRKQERCLSYPGCQSVALLRSRAGEPAGALRFEEREEISRGIAASVARYGLRIALGLRRSPSTVSREIRRTVVCSAYRAGEADRRAWQRALRPKFCRLARHARLRWRVAQKLALQWSPEQIAGWLKRQLPADQGMQISHETIYRSLFYSDPRRAEEAADGASADGAADASSQGRQYKEWTGDRSSILSPSANGRPRLWTAPCQVTGKEIFSPGRTTRTSRRSSSAIPAL